MEWLEIAIPSREETKGAMLLSIFVDEGAIFSFSYLNSGGTTFRTGARLQSLRGRRRALRAVVVHVHFVPWWRGVRPGTFMLFLVS